MQHQLGIVSKKIGFVMETMIVEITGTNKKNNAVSEITYINFFVQFQPVTSGDFLSVVCTLLCPRP